MGGRNLQDQGGQGTLICSKTKDSSIRGHSLVPWAGKDNGGYSGRGGRRAGASSCGVVPSSRGNKTLSAATIEQAIALIEGEEPVDLLFVDLKIQDDLEGGLKLAKKAVEARPKLKVLYTSGQAVTDGMTALFVKQSAFLPKPYTVEQLATTLLAKFGIGSRSK